MLYPLTGARWPVWIFEGPSSLPKRVGFGFVNRLRCGGKTCSILWHTWTRQPGAHTPPPGNCQPGEYHPWGHSNTPFQPPLDGFWPATAVNSWSTHVPFFISMKKVLLLAINKWLQQSQPCLAVYSTIPLGMQTSLQPIWKRHRWRNLLHWVTIQTQSPNVPCLASCHHTWKLGSVLNCTSPETLLMAC